MLRQDRFLAWDGLYYRPIKAGGRVSLDKDIAQGFFPGDRDYSFVVDPNREKRLLYAEPTTVALLLLAGKTKAAEEVTREMVANDINHIADRDMAIHLITSYVWYRFDRLVKAHVQGDDTLVLQDAEYLQAHRDRLQGELRARVLEEGPIHYPVAYADQAFDYLDSLNILQKDARERLKRTKTPFDLKEILKQPNPQRIQKLVEGLNEIRAQMVIIPGGPIIESDTIARALVAEGEPAVDALIQAYDKDERLTRTVSYGGQFQALPHLLTVREAAFAILTKILGFGLTSPSDPYKRMTAPELQQYWTANKRLSPAERMFGRLADDSANKRIWKQAALAIVAVPRPLPGVSQSMAGETLREKNAPSVSELLAKRALQIAGSGPLSSSEDQFDAAEAIDVGLALAKWDPAAAKPTLEALTKRALELTVDTTARGNAEGTLTTAAGKLIAKRLQLGDDRAWADYERLVPAIQPEGYIDVNAYQPLWMAPENLHAEALARHLFLDPESIYQKMSRSTKGLWYPIQGMVDSPMLRLAAFRELLIQILDDKRVVGTTTREKDSYRYSLSEGGGGGSYSWLDMFPEVPVGASAPLRVCDQLAVQVGQLRGAKRFNAIATDEARDAQIAELIALLRRSSGDALLTENGKLWLRGN